MKSRKQQKNDKLKRRYYDSRLPGSFGGVQALKRATGFKQNQVERWLKFQDTYTLHKPVRQKFTRRRVIVSGIDDQWQADLIDVRSLNKENDGFVYILTCIDVLSKYAWAIPLKDKTGKSLVTAFNRILSQGRQPSRLQTDKGTEFRNRLFQQFLKDKGIHFFVTQNEDIKASIVERFNRTLKEKLWRYFTKTNTRRYVEALPSLVRSYNQSYHRSIKTSPVYVTRENQERVWQTLYDVPAKKPVPPLLQKGDRVRISKARRTFKKGYLPSWTEELFTISRVNKTTPVTYVLKDDHNEELEGTFYRQEVQKVGEKEIYKIEKVLKHRTGRKGQKQYLVQWLGYPSSFNSWLPQSALVRYSD